MATPCVLITSCSDYDGENIVKDILGMDSLSAGSNVIEDIVSYDWSIDTKYYTADVRLCTTKRRTIGDQCFAEAVQAFIVYFDPSKKSTFDGVKSWNAYLDQIDPEVKMLVCDRCTDGSSISRLDAQTWCIENGFELVELNADTESDSETEDDFLETTGLPRIIQSLHAHTWPNLVLKENPKTVSPYIRQLMKEEFDSREKGTSDDDNIESEGNQSAEGISAGSDIDCADDTACTCGSSGDTSAMVQSLSQGGDSDPCGGSGDGDSAPNTVQASSDKMRDGDSKQRPLCEYCGLFKKELRQAITGEDVSQKDLKSASLDEKKKVKQVSKEERIDALLPAEDLALFNALGSEDPDGESFEKLFEQFASMKDKASNLPPQERKKYAENVAIAFWKAMGGEEDEIGDLDDSD